MGKLFHQFFVFGVPALAIGRGIFWMAAPPKNVERYGSGWHLSRHKFGHIVGRVANVRVCILRGGHANVTGLVCRQCGHVDVDDLLAEGVPVVEKIHGRSTREFTWTTLKQVLNKS